MLLTINEICKITKGAVRVEEENGAFRFYRFTAAQEKAYFDSGRVDLAKKTSASAGVRLAFQTNSQKLAFDYEFFYGSSRKYGYFDLYINGAMISHFGLVGNEMTAGHAELELGKGEKCVEVYFPWSRRTDLSNVMLDDGATLAPIDRNHTMISFGDSITHGYDATYPSLSYASRIARLLNADAVNKGIGGEVFFPDFLVDAEPFAPDYITVAYGTNDWNGWDRPTVEKNCRAFYKRLSELYPSARIFAITPIWRGDTDRTTPFGAPLQAVDTMIREACAALANVHVITGFSFVPQKSAFYEDLVLHPNDLGFGSYAENLFCEMLPFLK